MASLDLGTLKVGVKVEGADKAKADLKGVETATKGIDKNSEKSSKGIKTLSGSFKEASGSGKGLSGSLGSLVSSFGGGTSASGLLAGAIGGLATGFVMLATQAIQQAITAMIEFTKQSVQVASDLEESANVVQVVFGEDNKVSKWAQESASAFNLSRLEAEKFAGTMGAVLTPTKLGKDSIEDMSITLTKLSGDLGSLWNKSSEEAFNALRSAITGEMEPMKSFGVVMSQANLEAFALSEGINKTWKEMNEAEKATLRYNYILENTKTAQGDAARTADGYANSSKQLELAMENASAAMGSQMLPGLADIKNTLRSIIEDNQELFTFIGNVLGLIIDQFALWFKVIANSPIVQFGNALREGVLKVLNKIIDAVRAVYQAFSNFIDRFKKDSSDGVEDAYEKIDRATIDGLSVVDTSTEEGLQNVLDSIVDANSKAYSSFDDMYKDVQGLSGEHYDTLKEQANQYNDDYKYYDDVLTKYVRDGVRDKEKEWDRLNEKNANSDTLDFALSKARYLRQEEIKLEKEVEGERKKNEDKYMSILKNSWEQQNSIITKGIEVRKAEYEKDKEAFAKAEREKTQIFKDEEAKRSEKKSGFSFSNIFGGSNERALGDTSTTFSGVNNRYANGTLSAPGGFSVVGEVGRELMYVPPKAQIINNTTTEQILQGNDTTGVESKLDILIGAIQKVERVIKMLPGEQQMLVRGGSV